MGPKEAAFGVLLFLPSIRRGRFTELNFSKMCTTIHLKCDFSGGVSFASELENTSVGTWCQNTQGF